MFVACGAETSAPRNLLLVSLDTTRLDHLSTYGYPRPTAPHLDRLAHDGVVFRNALSQWTATNPSHTSMFTGLYPHVHGVGTNTARLPEELLTLAEILSSAGLRTGAFVSGYTMRSGKTGIDRGFDVYDSHFDGTRRDGRKTGELAIEWLESLQSDERWFLFLHLYDAHGPYRGDGRYLDLFRSEERGPRLKYIPEYQLRHDDTGKPLRHLNDYIDRYDAEIRYQDEVAPRQPRILGRLGAPALAGQGPVDSVGALAALEAGFLPRDRGGPSALVRSGRGPRGTCRRGRPQS